MKLVKESLKHTFTRGNEDKLKSLGIGRFTFTKEELEKKLDGKVYNFEITPSSIKFTIDMNEMYGLSWKDSIYNFILTNDNILRNSCPGIWVDKLKWPELIKSLDDIEDAITDQVSWEVEE